MNISELKSKAKKLFQKAEKFKYAFLVLILGVILMMIPVKDKHPGQEQSVAVTTGETEFSGQLEAILSLVEGAGETKVLLTMETGKTTVYQTDIVMEEDDTGKNKEEKTVLASSGSGGQQAVVKGDLCPTYRGALVVCQGADRASVRLQIIQAVSGLTGLSSDRITVIKMNCN